MTAPDRMAGDCEGKHCLRGDEPEDRFRHNLAPPPD